ncbi:EPIDERMAL PATTERNING FACTOR-like protein 9 [Nymphaea thermarum]|nr:EPIDERMAL PATTERNING FACTOR-like protein 9 [Nymphaea thermarum]
MGIKPRTNFCCLLFLLYAVYVSASAFSLSGTVDGKGQLPPNTHHSGEGNLQEVSGGSDRSARRLLIGSTAPICTYNECRGCKTRCSAEQVPVNANDPMNSAYRYRCICHR